MRCLIHYGKKRFFWSQHTLICDVLPFTNALGRENKPYMYTVNPDHWRKGLEQFKDDWIKSSKGNHHFAAILKNQFDNGREVTEEKLLSLDPDSYSRFYIETEDQEWDADQYRYSNYWASLVSCALYEVEDEIDKYCNSPEQKANFFQEMAIKPTGELIF